MVKKIIWPISVSSFHFAVLVTKEEVRLSASEPSESEWCWQIVGHWLWLSAELQEHQTPAGRPLRPKTTQIPTKRTSTSQNMMAAYFALSVLLFNSVLALPQNFEDIDLASDQPDGEVDEFPAMSDKFSPSTPRWWTSTRRTHRATPSTWHTTSPRTATSLSCRRTHSTPPCTSA